MIETLSLPNDPMDLAEVVEQQVMAEQSRRAPRFARWLIAHAYLTGCRHFVAVDPRGVRVSAFHFQQADGKTTMPTEVATLLSHVNRVQGALMSGDMGPAVIREGFSLSGLRDKASAQVILDSLVGETSISNIKLPLTHNLSYLGTAGITGHLVDHPAVGLRADLQTIHSRELYPFPSIGWDSTKQHGLVWERIVPLDWLSAAMGKKGGYSEKEIGEMDVYETPYTTMFSLDNSSSNHPINKARLNYSSATPQTVRVAKIREVWIKGPLGFVDRYFVTCGRMTLRDVNLKGKEAYCPVGVAKFYDTGDFDGAGLFDLLWSLERNFEHMVDSLVKNVKGLSTYPLAILPAGQVDEGVAFKESGAFRYISVAPDARMLFGGARPMPPQIWGPHNSGELPGRAGQFLRGIADSISPVRDLIEEKGRIDSAAGLNRLEEETRKPLTVPTQQLGQALSSVYRSLLRDASEALSTSPRPLPVKRIGLELAGAVIDWETGEARFPQNPLPDISSLTISVRQLTAKSEAARKAEALELHQAQISTLEQLILLLLKEGIDIAMYLEPERAAYETIIMHILTLFGDGISPGQIVTAPSMSRPDLQAIVLRGFLSSPIVALASVDVQNALITYSNKLMTYMGVPTGQPDAYDIMLIEQARSETMRAMQSAAPQPQGLLQ